MRLRGFQEIDPDGRPATDFLQERRQSQGQATSPGTNPTQPNVPSAMARMPPFFVSQFAPGGV